MQLLGVNVDARYVALARAAIMAGIVAVVAAVETVLASPDWEGYAWVPIVLLVLRVVEGFIDHSDKTRTG